MKSLRTPTVSAVLLFAILVGGTAEVVEGQEPLARFYVRNAGFERAATTLPLSYAPSVERDRWAPFLARSGGGEVFLDAETLRPLACRVQYLPLIPGQANGLTGGPSDLASVFQSVDSFIASNQGLIRLPLGFTLSRAYERSRRVGPEYWIVRYDLIAGSTPVADAGCDFYLQNGNLADLSCRNLLSSALPASPTVTSSQAIDAFLALIGGTIPGDNFDPPVLLLVPDRESTPKYRLAWQFRFNRESDDLVRVRIDADSLAVLEVRSLGMSATAHGVVRNTTVGSDTLVDVSFPFLDWSNNKYTKSDGTFDPGGETAIFSRMNGQYSRLYADSRCGSGDFSVFGDATGINLGSSDDATCSNPSSWNSLAARTAYFAIEDIRAYAVKRMATRQVKDDLQRYLEPPTAQDRLRFWTHWDGKPLYDLSCNGRFFPEGRGMLHLYKAGVSGGRGCRDFGEIPSGVAHEWGHGVDAFDEAPTDSEASQEAYADIVAATRYKDSCASRGFFASPPCASLLPCETCNGSRDLDYMELSEKVPLRASDVATKCLFCDQNGNCQIDSHCASLVAGQTFWDFVARDLQDGSYLDVRTPEDAWRVAEELWWGSVGTHQEVYLEAVDDHRGCAAFTWYPAFLRADRIVAPDGTPAPLPASPHGRALFNAFNRHEIACGEASDPYNQDGCQSLAAPDAITTSLSGATVQVAWQAVPGAFGYYVLRSRRGCPTLPPEGSDCAQGAGGVETCKFLVLGNGTTTWNAILPDAGMYGFAVVPIGHSKRCLGTPSSCSVVYVCFDGQSGTELSEDNGVSVEPVISTAPLSAATASLTQIEAVADGSFEAGRTGISWQTSATRGSPIIHQAEGSAQARSGRYVAELGGSNNVTDLLSQTVILPTGAASPALRFSSWVRSTGNEGASGDHLVVSIDALDGSPLVEVARLTAADSGSEWMDHAAISLAGWSGRAFGLRFEASTNNTSPTTFFIDDVSLVYTPTASSLSVAFLNPRTGCGGFGGGRIEVGGSTDISVVSTVSGPGGKTLIRRNGEVIGWSYGSRAIAHLDVTDSNESITLEAEAVEKDGRRAICPIQVIPRQVLLDSGFEDGPGELNWTTTSTGTGFNRSQVIISGQNPRPAFGDYMLRLGARTGTTQKASQRFKVPTDIQSGTVSFYLRVFTMKNTSTELDLLKVILVADDGSAIEELIRFSNASAATVASTEPGAYSLVLLPIPTQFYGKVVDIRFEASITNSNPTTFFLDGIGVTLTSRSLDQDPPLVLNVNLASVQPLACDSVAVVADASADADRLRLIDARTGATLASCEFCSSVSATIALGGANCRPIRLEAETTATLQRSPIFWVVPDAARCPGGGGVSSPTFQFPLNGEVLNGLVHARSANADAACTRESRVFLDGVMVKQTTGGIVDYLLDSSQIADGLHRLDVQSVNASGDVSPLLGSSSTTFRIANSLPCEAFVNETLACSPDASDHVSSGFSLCDLREPRCTGTFTGPQGAIDSELIEFLRFCAARALVRVRAGEINCTGVLVGTTEDFATILTAADCVTDVDATAITVAFEGSADQTPRSATCGSCGNGGTCSSSISTADAWALVQLRPDAVPPDVLPVPLARRDEFPEGEVRAVGMWLDSPAAQPNRPLVATSQDSDGRFYPASVTIAPDGTAVTNTDFDGAAANLCNAGGVLFSYDKRVIGVATKASAGDCLTESCRSVSRPAFSVPTNATCTTCANPNRIARITSYPSYWAADSYKIRAQIGDEPSGVPEVDFQRIQVEVQKNDSPPVVVGCCSKVGDCSDPCANGTIVGNVCELNWMSALVTPETNARFVLRVSGVDSEGCVAKESQVAIRLWRCGSGGATYDAYMDYNCAQP